MSDLLDVFSFISSEIMVPLGLLFSNNWMLSAILLFAILALIPSIFGHDDSN